MFFIVVSISIIIVEIFLYGEVVLGYGKWIEVRRMGEK